MGVAQRAGHAMQYSARRCLQQHQSSNRACLGMATVVSTLVHCGPMVSAGRHSRAYGMLKADVRVTAMVFWKPPSQVVAKTQHARHLTVSHSDFWRCKGSLKSTYRARPCLGHLLVRWRDPWTEIKALAIGARAWERDAGKRLGYGVPLKHRGLPQTFVGSTGLWR